MLARALHPASESSFPAHAHVDGPQEKMAQVMVVLTTHTGDPDWAPSFRLPTQLKFQSLQVFTEKTQNQKLYLLNETRKTNPWLYLLRDSTFQTNPSARTLSLGLELWGSAVLPPAAPAPARERWLEPWPSPFAPASYRWLAEAAEDGPNSQDSGTTLRDPGKSQVPGLSLIHPQPVQPSRS